MPDHQYHGPSSLEPYFQQTAEGGIWHPISQLPMTEPKVSSITVRVDEFKTWEYDWLEIHREDCSSDARWGPLPDAYVNPFAEDENHKHLLFCCGAERPNMRDRYIVVTPRTPSEEFVTVHDFLSTVHPWLMGFRDELVKFAKERYFGPTSTEDMMVDPSGLERLSMSDSADWIKYKSQKLKQPQL